MSSATGCPFTRTGLPFSSTFTSGWRSSESMALVGSKVICAPDSCLSLTSGSNCPGERPELRLFMSRNILLVIGFVLTPSASRMPLPVTQPPFLSIIPPLLKWRSRSTGMRGKTVSSTPLSFLLMSPLAAMAPSSPLSAISAYWSECCSMKYSTATFSNG